MDASAPPYALRITFYVSRLPHPLLRPHHRRLRAAIGVQLVQDAGDVRLHRVRGDIERPRNLLVAAPVGQEAQHVGLPLGQHFYRRA
jgi:hypothetical protein